MFKINSICILFLMIWSIGCSQQKSETMTTYDGEKILKSDADWKEELTSEEYRVLREKGTERAFTGEYYNSKDKGTYVCAGCQLPLFDSETKFDSGTGWPSYYKPINSKCIGANSDISHGMIRTEVVCGRCDGHLGHVFNDGPEPTGMRYCINSVSLDFQPSQGKTESEE